MISILLAVVLTAQAGEKVRIDEAYELANNGRFADAELLLRKLKSPIAKARRAVLIYKDLPVMRVVGLTEFDPDLARRLVKESMPTLEKDAKSDGASAAILAAIYKKGIGVEMDMAKSAQLYESAAKLGYSSAKCQLGIMYLFGEGVRKDPSKGFGLIKEAADSGLSSNDITALGQCYLDGRGVARDRDRAEELFEDAAELGNVRAMEICADASFRRFQEAFGNNDFVRSAKEMATHQKWLTRASDAGSVAAKVALATHYVAGPFANEVLCFRFSNDAASSGLALPLASLACCRLQGIGCRKSPKEAAKLISQALEAARRDEDERMEKALKRVVSAGDEESREEALVELLGWQRANSPKP